MNHLALALKSRMNPNKYIKESGDKIDDILRRLATNFQELAKMNNELSSLKEEFASKRYTYSKEDIYAFFTDVQSRIKSDHKAVHIFWSCLYKQEEEDVIIDIFFDFLAQISHKKIDIHYYVYENALNLNWMNHLVKIKNIHVHEQKPKYDSIFNETFALNNNYIFVQQSDSQIITVAHANMNINKDDNNKYVFSLWDIPWHSFDNKWKDFNYFKEKFGDEAYEVSFDTIRASYIHRYKKKIQDIIDLESLFISDSLSDSLQEIQEKVKLRDIDLIHYCLNDYIIKLTNNADAKISLLFTYCHLMVYSKMSNLLGGSSNVIRLGIGYIEKCKPYPIFGKDDEISKAIIGIKDTTKIKKANNTDIVYGVVYAIKKNKDTLQSLKNYIEGTLNAEIVERSNSVVMENHPDYPNDGKMHLRIELIEAKETQPIEHSEIQIKRKYDIISMSKKNKFPEDYQEVISNLWDRPNTNV